MSQTTDTILMIRPARFCFNPETESSNAFQVRTGEDPQMLRESAIREFDNFARDLAEAGVRVLAIEDTDEPAKPDAVFPNNWFSTHVLEDGRRVIVIYPMLSEARRNEVREDIIARLCNDYGYERMNLSEHQERGRYLEGTGSIVFDHKKKRAYAVKSPRTDDELVRTVGGEFKYKSVIFDASDSNGKSVYHTNVILTIGEDFVVVCGEMIRDEKQRKKVLDLLSEGRELIVITEGQAGRFAGNMIQLTNQDGERILVMSKSAADSLDSSQSERLTALNDRIVIAEIPVIETAGGGSARCMIAEIFYD